jgi:hypothetical protein
MISLISCSKSEQALSEKPVQRTFASTQEAGAALVEAMKSGDRNAVLALFGPEGNEIVFSGDGVKDKDNFQDFVAAYEQMHRWREIKAGGEMLYTGADNFAFPIPLGKNSSGQWYFDTAAGKDEILARRIGKDELAAIAACKIVADAQKEYFNQAHGGDHVKQYAQKLVSDDGKQDGLYWPASVGTAASPLQDLGDLAKTMGYSSSAVSNPQPFFGYYFRVLTKQGDKAKGGAKDYITDGKMTGGFGVVAYPVKYRDSGIMTFVVGVDGVVYQKDLGESTSTTAQALAEYNPSDGWSPAI